MQTARLNPLLTRSRALLLVGVSLITFSFTTHAAAQNNLSGIAVINESNQLQINGHSISLWGIDMLAPDQQCWEEGTAWGCGEEARIALRHFADGKLVRCDVLVPADKDGAAYGKCYRIKGPVEKDIAEHLVKHGWALDRGVQSGGMYYNAEQEAQTSKCGAWQGRFQTAQDWKAGVQKFVGDEENVQSEEPASPSGSMDVE